MLRINSLLSTELTLLLGMTLSGCVVQQTTKLAEFPKMYEEKPTTILILPPINESSDAKANDYYSTTIPIPLLLHGYYVFPYELTSETLKQEGVYDNESFCKIPLKGFFEYFGADAVLFTTIKKWDLSYVILASSLTVSIDCVIKSTHTSRTLWSYSGKVVVDLSGGNSGSGLVAITSKAMEALPYGRYHELYLQDTEHRIVDQTPEKKVVQ